MYEPDYISPWRATSRAFLLEQSLVLSHLSQHFDALFFEPFIKDVCHPFSAEDLSELGLPVDWPEEEPSDRPDQSEVPNFEDVPSDSSVSDGHGNRIPGQPLRQLPSWVTDLWNLLQYEGATELLEEGPIIYVSAPDTSATKHVLYKMRADLFASLGTIPLGRNKSGMFGQTILIIIVVSSSTLSLRSHLSQ